MSDIWPPRNLGGESEEWGRRVEIKSDETAQALEILTQEVRGQNRSTASSLSSLAGQINDLAGRKSYYANSTDLFQLEKMNAAPAPAPIATVPFGPSVNFTLGERRLVRITIVATLYAQVAAASGASGTASIGVAAMIDGTRTFTNSEIRKVTASDPPFGGISQVTSDIFTVSIFRVMEPGKHTVGVALADLSIAPASGNYYGYLTAQDPSLVVDVLQIAN